MPTSMVELDATAVDVRTDSETLRVVLADGREVSAPLMWFPRLFSATQEQRSKWRLMGHGMGIAGMISTSISQSQVFCANTELTHFREI